MIMLILSNSGYILRLSFSSFWISNCDWNWAVTKNVFEDTKYRIKTFKFVDTTTKYTCESQFAFRNLTYFLDLAHEVQD